MPSLNRRRFLKSSAAAAAASTPTVRSLAQAVSQPMTLTLHPERPGATVPANFIGLSYETEELTNPRTFSVENPGLIAQFRKLTPNGVLRIGGNTSDVGWWKPTPSSTPPPMPTLPHEVGEPSTDLSYPITPEAVHALRGFLDASGWTCIYGLNLGTEPPARSADQAVAVAAALGPKLEYFQIGNEPDLLAPHLRDKTTWTPDRYFDEWLAVANAVRARVPGARFGLPDAASDVQWFNTVTARLGALPDPPKVAALTHHYYIGGPPSNPAINIPRILTTDPRVPKDAAVVRDASAKLGVPYRMTEGNTCYRGGKPGVSDVFAAALWAAEYSLTLASLGYAGINPHGGDGGKFVGNSLGGHLPGEDLLRAHEAPHPRPFYTPIANMNGTYVAEPVFYGLGFTQRFAGATFFPVDLHTSADAVAFAAHLPTGQTAVAVINKDPHLPVPLNLAGYIPALVLTAPSLEARSADLAEPQGFTEASAVPPASAMLLLHIRQG